MALKVIHWLHAFSNAIRRTFVQHFTRFQLTVCSHGFSALAELLVASHYSHKRAVKTQNLNIQTSTTAYNTRKSHVFVVTLSYLLSSDFRGHDTETRRKYNFSARKQCTYFIVTDSGTNYMKASRDFSATAEFLAAKCANDCCNKRSKKS